MREECVEFPGFSPMLLLEMFFSAYVVAKRGTSQVSQKLCSSSEHKQQMITLN